MVFLKMVYCSGDIDFCLFSPALMSLFVSFKIRNRLIWEGKVRRTYKIRITQENSKKKKEVPYFQAIMATN